MTATTRSNSKGYRKSAIKAQPSKDMAKASPEAIRKGVPAVVKNNESEKIQSTEYKGWNTMSHLSLKRFADDDPTLTAGARRDRMKHPSVAVAELDPSGRAVCKLCGQRICKNTLRLGLWLECHKGYRNLCTLHETCFWLHPETKKLEKVDEISMQATLSSEKISKIRSQFASFSANLEKDEPHEQFDSS